MKKATASILYVKQTISDGSIYSALTVGAPSAAHISPLWIENIISSISLAQYVRPCSEHRTATMSMKARSTVITTIQPSLLSDAMVVKPRFLSSSLRFSGMDKISIGILNAT